MLGILPYLAAGCWWVNVEYRLARNSPAPAAVEDCRCALAWVIRHAQGIRVRPGEGDPDRIFGRRTPRDHRPVAGGFGVRPPVPYGWRWPLEQRRWANFMSPPSSSGWFGITDVADLLDSPNAKHYAIEWFDGMVDAREALARQVSPINTSTRARRRCSRSTATRTTSCRTATRSGCTRSWTGRCREPAGHRPGAVTETSAGRRFWTATRRSARSCAGRT